MLIEENILRLKKTLPKNVLLIAVSKNQSVESIMTAYKTGIRDFGENRVQELQYKAQCLPKDIQWHFIGHLQSNKAKLVAQYAHVIHSIDSIALLKKLDKCCLELNLQRRCLLQILVAEEISKFGFLPNTLKNVLTASNELLSIKQLQIIGLMGMASHTNNEAKITCEFQEIKTNFEVIKKLDKFPDFKEISMGMSNDYKIAIQNGSTMIRLGSCIFG
ncbi:MAG: YggS family pyridoxal phosphate-dependent enzyme [Bacteroidales bacterium]